MEINTLQESINRKANEHMDKDWVKLERELSILHQIKHELSFPVNGDYKDRQTHQVINKIKEAFYRDRRKHYAEVETSRFLNAFDELKEKTAELENQYLSSGN